MSIFYYLTAHAHAEAPAIDDNFQPLYDKLLEYYNGLFVPLAVVLAGMVIVYAGILYATSEGQPEKINAAKEWIMGAIIGLVIVLGAGWIISQIVS
jgi:hypothetical protein